MRVEITLAVVASLRPKRAAFGQGGSTRLELKHWCHTSSCSARLKLQAAQEPFVRFLLFLCWVRAMPQIAALKSAETEEFHQYPTRESEETKDQGI